MFRRSLLSPIQRLIGISPFESRPSGMNSKKGNMFVGAHHFKNRDADDPSRTSSLNGLVIKVCTKCGRTRQIPSSQREYFHTCCEGVVMRFRGTVGRAVSRPKEIKKTLRQWDFDNNRPWSNPRRPRPKGRNN